MFSALSALLAGCTVPKPSTADLQGRWTLSEAGFGLLGTDAGQGSPPSLTLSADHRFSALNVPCSLVPFGCPEDGSTGPPVSGDGTWEITLGKPASLSGKRSPYTKVLLTFQRETHGNTLEPQPARAELLVGHDRTFYLYTWKDEEGSARVQWQR